MKRIATLAIIAGVALVNSAHAEKYGTAGCGVGSLVFQDQPGKIQILAATTNYYLGQTFSITSGTSNCLDDATNTVAMYVAVNEQALKKDISRGNGETLSGLSRILKCENTELLGSKLQQNYGMIFPAASTDAEAAGQSIRSTIKNDGVLAKSCGAV